MSQASGPAAGEASAAVRQGKFLTFRLGEETYGLEILKVREIMGLMVITPVPRTPEFVKGVINLRGKVIPVIDLRMKFGMPAAVETNQTCIVVVDIGVREMGIVVDQVYEVMNMGEDDIVPPPSFGTSVNVEFIWGMSKIEGRVIILLDITHVLAGEDIRELLKIPGREVAKPDNPE